MSGETIAVFTKNRTNPAYDAARLGAERAAARLGARIVHYVPEKPDDVAQQVALVARAIEDRPDAVVFAPVHLSALDASVNRLNAAGIPTVNYLNRMAQGRFVSFVGSDDYRLARDIAGYLFRRIGGSGSILLMEGVPHAVTSRERMRGFRDAAAAWPGIRIVATLAGDYQEPVARQAMARYLAAHPCPDAILAANDVMATGILRALDAVGKLAPVTGVNALPEAIDAIKAGRMLATADFDALKIGCIATEAAVRHLRGESVPAEILLPVRIVDRDNCLLWDRPIAGRLCPRWEEVVGHGRPDAAPC